MTYFSKIESAKILLEDSIDNYFNDIFTPSSFLLAGNSRWILKDLLKKKGEIPYSFTWIKDNTDIDTNSVENDLRMHSNFFKHSDRKHDEIKEILCTEGMLEIILYDKSSIYKQLVGSKTKKMNRFSGYLNFKNREHIPDEKMKQKMYDVIKELGKVPTKQEFYNL